MIPKLYCMRIFSTLWVMFSIVFAGRLQAQTYTPITVTGYNHDIFAEAFPNAIATTDTVLDATIHIMYTRAFALASGLPAGLPDNGLITDASNTHQYQLAPYNALNALTLMRNTNKQFTLTSPASFAKLSLLCFTTENAGTVNVSVKFTNGTSSSYITNYTVPDWFNNNNNVVISGFGRCQRVATAPYGQDGFPSDPRFYFLDFNLSCADQLKSVEGVVLSNVTTTGVNAPFPNVVFLGLSGVPYSQTISSSALPATCTQSNGSASLNITGNSGPYTISWNTNPVQTGLSAINLSAGPYIANVTNFYGCTTPVSVTVPLQSSSVIVSTQASPSNICSGSTAQLNVSSTGGSLANYTWTPGNLSGPTVTVQPTTTTTYTVTGQDQFGCGYLKTVTVNVLQAPVPATVNGVQVCLGNQASLAVSNPQAGAIYNWYNTAVGGNALGTGISFTTGNLNATTIFYVETAGITGCSNTTRTAVTVTVNNPPALPVITAPSVCPGAQAILSVQNPVSGNIYSWFTTSTGGNPIATGNSFQTPPLSGQATYYVDVTSMQGCLATSRTPVSVQILQQLPKPVVVIGTITSSSINFSWASIPNATGYEVSLDGGANFQDPSTGPNGLSHLVSGLNPGEQVTIVVRALGAVNCQNSLLSDAVTAFVPNKIFFVPNVFTPNGDGKNDQLMVFSHSISQIDFKIFNQWGVQVFASTKQGNGWDGKYKGVAQPVGVYVYILKLVLTDGTVLHKKGSVSLLR